MGIKYKEAKGKKGSTNLIIPKPPNLSNIAASKTEPIVEASTCASGSHK